MGMGFPFASAKRAGLARAESSRRVRLGGALLPGDPNPLRFEFEHLEKFGDLCVAIVRWPDSSNFEGRKIAVYRATPGQLRQAKRLDPHFQEKTGPLVPIARFEPTERGLDMARALAFEFAESGGRPLHPKEAADG